MAATLIAMTVTLAADPIEALFLAENQAAMANMMRSMRTKRSVLRVVYRQTECRSSGS